MKIKNFFKKDSSKTTNANVQKLEKNQLEKVIGGIDTTGDLGTVAPISDPILDGQINKSKSNVKNN
jgi:hypothetical protein